MKQLTDALPCCLDGSLCGLAQQGFELCKDLFDGIEVGRVGRQEQQVGSGVPDRGTHGAAFVAAEVVHDDDVAWLQRGHQDLGHVGKKACAVDRAVEHARCADAVMTQACEKRHGLPVAMRGFGVEPPAGCAPAAQRRHIGLGPRLVDEDEAAGIDPRLIFLPADTAAGNVRPVLLAWQEAFF